MTLARSCSGLNRVCSGKPGTLKPRRANIHSGCRTAPAFSDREKQTRAGTASGQCPAHGQGDCAVRGTPAARRGKGSAAGFGQARITHTRLADRDATLGLVPYELAECGNGAACVRAPDTGRAAGCDAGAATSSIGTGVTREDSLSQAGGLGACAGIGTGRCASHAPEQPVKVGRAQAQLRRKTPG